MANATKTKPIRKTESAPNSTAQTSEWASYFKKLSSQYGSLPMQNINEAFMRAMPFSAAFTNNPYIQNRRVKNISSLPVDVTKQQIVDMLKNPNDSEQSLRQVSNILEYTAYPMFKIRSTYQDLLSYHWYVYPAYADKEDTKKKDFLREWRITYKLAEELQVQRSARQIVGQCIRDGKVFYYPRYDVDKSHNKVRKATMQQLPQDWTKIVGFNSKSKYTVAFNMFYFLQPGTTPMQFGELFEPYLEDFKGILDGTPSIVPTNTIYNKKKYSVDRNKYLELCKRNADGKVNGSPNVYSQNGTWFYWVTLPVDKIWTFEIDDVKPNVVSPLTGLFLSMDGIAQYEQVQLEIIQNPLVAMVLGTIETYDPTAPMESDPVKISPTGQQFFNNMFYQMMAQTNTGGIGVYSAPYKDMKLVQLSEAPNATKISAAAYEAALGKTGLSAMLPATSESRAGVAQISLKLESRFAQHIYGQVERMMNEIFSSLDMTYDWKFRMFGDLATDADMLKSAKEGMTLGILSTATFQYFALQGHSILDDLSMSSAVYEMDIMSLRLPLISTYTAKQGEGTLPPQPGNQGGRPSGEGEATTTGGEADVDDATGANEI